MARQVLAAVLVLLGLVLAAAGFQEYVDGSCAAGNCVFNSGLSDPIFVVIGALSIIAGVLLFLNRGPFKRRTLPPPPPAPRQYHPRNDGSAGLMLFALQADTLGYVDTVDSGGVDWWTVLLVAAVVGGLIFFVYERRKRADREGRR